MRQRRRVELQHAVSAMHLRVRRVQVEREAVIDLTGVGRNAAKAVDWDHLVGIVLLQDRCRGLNRVLVLHIKNHKGVTLQYLIAIVALAIAKNQPGWGHADR